LLIFLEKVKKNNIKPIAIAVAILVLIVVGAFAYTYTAPKTTTPVTTTMATKTAPAIPEPTTLRVASWAEAASLDPASAISGALYTVSRNTYESLLMFKGSSVEDYDPVLATSWTFSPDGKVYTFTLRQGVKFQDGTPFNASAVKFSYERAIGVNKGPAAYLKVIDKIDVIDNYQVRFTLKNASALFPKHLAGLYGWQIVSPSAVQAHATADDRWAEKWLLDHSVGTGPYVIKEWVRQDHILLEQFPSYWKGWKPGQIQRIMLKLVSQASSQRQLLEKGDVDIAENLLTEDQIAMQNVTGVTNFTPKMYASLWQIQFDTTRPPLSDAQVRRALLYALDPSAFVKLASGIARPATSPLPSFMLPYYTNQNAYATDTNNAAKLLDGAGWKMGSDGFRSKDGQRLTLVYHCAAGDEFRRKIGEEMKSQWQKIGVEVTVAPEVEAITYGRLLKGDKVAHLYILGGYGYSDPFLYLSDNVYTRAFPYNNMGHYSNPTVDNLLDQLSSTTDIQQRTNIARQLQRIVMADDPAGIYILEAPETYSRFQRDWVQGRVYNPAYWRALNGYDMWKGYPSQGTPISAQSIGVQSVSPDLLAAYHPKTTRFLRLTISAFAH